MGNYTKISGRICIDTTKKLNAFKDSWRKEMSDYPEFENMFILEYKFEDTFYLHFNPLYNEYKLVGYPDNFEEFFGFFRDNIKSTEYIHIFGFEESDGIVEFYMESENSGKIWFGSTYDNNTTRRIKTWHLSFIESMPKDLGLKADMKIQKDIEYLQRKKYLQ